MDGITTEIIPRGVRRGPTGGAKKIRNSASASVPVLSGCVSGIRLARVERCPDCTIAVEATDHGGGLAVQCHQSATDARPTGETRIDFVVREGRPNGTDTEPPSADAVSPSRLIRRTAEAMSDLAVCCELNQPMIGLPLHPGPTASLARREAHLLRWRFGGRAAAIVEYPARWTSRRRSPPAVRRGKRVKTSFGLSPPTTGSPSSHSLSTLIRRYVR